MRRISKLPEKERIHQVGYWGKRHGQRNKYEDYSNRERGDTQWHFEEQIAQALPGDRMFQASHKILPPARTCQPPAAHWRQPATQPFLGDKPIQRRHTPDAHDRATEQSPTYTAHKY